MGINDISAIRMVGIFVVVCLIMVGGIFFASYVGRKHSKRR